jgi:DeoR family myo-inositol catabolism operon transcriptional repressor
LNQHRSICRFDPAARALIYEAWTNVREFCGPNQGFVRRFNANICITGASGVTPAGPCDANLDAARLKRTMISRAYKTALTVDHSKFDRYALETVCPWSDIGTIVTDRMPADAFQEIFNLHGVDLIVAGDEKPSSPE